MGLSVALVSDEERDLYRKLCTGLNKPNGIPKFPIKGNVVGKVRQTVNEAKKIISVQRKEANKKMEMSWFEKQAKAADMILDMDF